jgi:hypothetical protein
MLRTFMPSIKYSSDQEKNNSRRDRRISEVEDRPMWEMNKIYDGSVVMPKDPVGQVAECPTHYKRGGYTLQK